MLARGAAARLASAARAAIAAPPAAIQRVARPFAPLSATASCDTVPLACAANTPQTVPAQPSAHAAVTAPAAPASGTGGAGSNGTGASGASQPWWQHAAFIALAGVLVGSIITGGAQIVTVLLSTKAATHAGKVPVEASNADAAELSQLARTLEDRLLTGIKARILKPEMSKRRQQQGAGAKPVGMAVPPLPRNAAHEMFKRLEADATKPCVVLAQKGHGKSWAARAYARDPANPHVIYVDLAGSGSFDAATKSVADAIGYRTAYTADEDRARVSGHGINDLDTPWTKTEYDSLLMLFFRACRELREEGKITGGRPVTLMLDHVTRPFTARPAVPLDCPPAAAAEDSDRLFDTLIYQTLETAKRGKALEQGHTRIVLITGDSPGELPSWQKPTMLYESLLPAFTQEEAEELLARCIHFKLHPEKRKDVDPDDNAVRKTKEDYASTIDFLIGTLGCRPRALAACFDHGAPLPDVDLAAEGVALPDALLPFLPKELPATVAAKLKLPDASALRVDAIALAAVVAAVEVVQLKLGELLFMPPSIVLPPTPSPDPQRSERVVQRVLNVDAGLRALLAAGTLDRTSFASALGSSNHLAPVLAEKHLVFYRQVNTSVVFESAMVQRVVAAVLDGPQHGARKELAQKLLGWQLANAELAAAADANQRAQAAAAYALKDWEAEKGFLNWSQQPSKSVELRKATTVAKRNAAAHRLEKAEADLDALVSRIEDLRPLVC